MRRWVHNLTGVSISLLLFYLSGLSLEPCMAILVPLVVNSLRTVAKPYSYCRHNKLRKGFDWLLRLMGEDVLLAAMALLVCNLNPTGFLPEAFTCLAFLTTGYIGSRFPDLDMAGRNSPHHRKLYHNVFSMLITSLPFVFVSPWVSLSWLLSYLSHLVLDSATRKGVSLVYPVSERVFRI